MVKAKNSDIDELNKAIDTDLKCNIDLEKNHERVFKSENWALRKLITNSSTNCTQKVHKRKKSFARSHTEGIH